MTNSATTQGAARQLPIRQVEKVWGRDELPETFPTSEGKRIGEIWFEPPSELPDLLVKYLFTSEKLSVQVHPADHSALGDEKGKEECWLVLDAEPGAKLAIGFKKEETRTRIEEAARDGSIEDLLAWYDAKAGDIFYLPAGTVHAIGPGLSLVEVQQNSDTTFRLYDYGRPRELHLARAIAVADCVTYPAECRSHISRRGTTLIDGPHFRLDRIEGSPDSNVSAAYTGGLLVLPLEGEVHVKAGGPSCGPGKCLYSRELKALDFSRAGITLLIQSKQRGPTT